MLLNDFFKIGTISEREEISPSGLPLRIVRMDIGIEPAHPIFAGHFPGNPVVPGVCQIHMITESLGKITGHAMKLVEADTVKFLSMIDPLQEKSLTLELAMKPVSGMNYPLQATLSSPEKTFLKLKGLFSAL